MRRAVCPPWCLGPASNLPACAIDRTNFHHAPSEHDAPCEERPLAISFRCSPSLRPHQSPIEHSTGRAAIPARGRIRGAHRSSIRSGRLSCSKPARCLPCRRSAISVINTLPWGQAAEVARERAAGRRDRALGGTISRRSFKTQRSRLLERVTLTLLQRQVAGGVRHLHVNIHMAGNGA
jgi:hypothetical protein